MNIARSAPSYSEFGDEDIRDVIVRSYTMVGQVQGMGQSTVSIEAREAFVPDRHLVDYSVRFELNTGGDYPQESFASVSYDEIDKMVSMLRKLETTSISKERFAFSEVQYEVNDIRFIVFNTAHGSTMVAVSASGVSIHFASLAKLSALTDMILVAKQHIEKHRIVR